MNKNDLHLSRYRNVQSMVKQKLCLTAIALPFLLVGCDKKPQEVKQQVAPGVIVYSVTNEGIGGHREFVARTAPFMEANLTARVEGELLTRNFKEGARVAKDDLLFVIDPATYEASLTQAKADLESKESAAESAKRNLKRGQEVAKQGFISQSDLDKLVTEDSQAKAAVSSAKAALEKAELNLSYTKIIAPFAGRMSKAQYDTGNVVSSNSGTLATLTAIDPMYVSFQVEEAQVVSYMQLRKSNDTRDQDSIDVSLRLPNNTIYDQLGEIEFADTKIGEGTGTIEIRAKFDNPDGVILPGLYVTLMIDGKDKADKILVPQMAVQENMQGKFVLVVNQENKVSTRLVKLGRRLNAMWIVESGLKEGERIIIQGLQKARAGAEVNPVEKHVNAQTGAVIDLVQ